MTSKTAVVRIRREHHDTISQLALVLSARVGRRLSQPDALYLASRFALAKMDELATFIEQLENGYSPLTEREREIAGLVAEGKTNAEIGGHLGISKRTVDAHVDHILGKLDVRTRTQIATWLISSRTAL
jgi:DNA-binding CsgD family transcriptional regulator